MPAPAEAAVPHPLKALIERWQVDHFSGSIVACTAEYWNTALCAEEAPKALLRRI